MEFALVTPNPDLDITLRRIGRGSELETEVELAGEAAGGKGHNAARLLTALGHDCTALGFSGGWVGQRIEELLRLSGVRCALTPIRRPNRIYVTISDAKGRRRVSYHARGPLVDAAEASSLISAISSIPESVARVVIGGSLPLGVSEEWYAAAVDAAGPARTLVDTSGTNLRAALRGGAKMVKVNLGELWGIVEGDAPRGVRHAAHWISRIAERHEMELLVVTLGNRGAIGWAQGQLVRVFASPVEVKSTLGAGDAFTAGMLHGEALGAGFAQQLRWAVAAGSAVCEQVDPGAVSVDRITALMQIGEARSAPAQRSSGRS